MCDDGWRIEREPGNGTRCDAVQFAAGTGRPDFSAQETQRHGDQAVIEVGQHDVLSPFGLFMIKHYGSDMMGIWMLKTLCTRCPASSELGQVEDFDTCFFAIGIV